MKHTHTWLHGYTARHEVYAHQSCRRCGQSLSAMRTYFCPCWKMRLPKRPLAISNRRESQEAPHTPQEAK